MSLSKHVDADELIERAAASDHLSLVQRAKGARKHISSAHAGRYATDPIPKYTMPKTGISNDAAYQLITDELSLDGKPTLNLASFVHTLMPQQATQLNTDNCMINLCDQDEYPATMAIHGRCVSMLADLWHAPKETDSNGKRVEAMGVATTGSSEAIMLGGLAMKRRWQEKRKAQGKEWKTGANVVFGSNAQVAIEKFARYFEVEERLVPVSKESHYRLDTKKALDLIDENTIGVIVILGSTYTGHYEPVEEMSKLLDEYEKKTGLDIPIHVDGASGAMVAPFAHPHLKWDFQLPRVKSINTSGHKFGMVYPGLGWILFRSTDMVPKDLIFELHYLGSTEYSFGLNFSRPASPVLMFYFNMISLGFKGFKDVMWGDMQNARLLSRALELSGYYEVLSDIHKQSSGLIAAGTKAGVLDDEDPENYEAGLPVVAFRWNDKFQAEHPQLEQRWMQTMLRAKGWIVPNYGLSPDCDKIEVLRVVVRENLSEDMIDQLVHDIITITENLIDENSSEAHLALAMSQKATISQGGSGTRAAALSKADDSMKFPKQGTRVSKHHHNLPEGSGVKAKGYAKQC